MKDLYSVIIPTLWRSQKIHKLIKDLSDCALVGEIIIIDNNKGFYNHYPSIFKGKIIGPDENLFVGPAWNLGVSVAKYNNIALCNDDINFDTSIFKDLLPFIDLGFIGMGGDNYKIDNFNGLGIKISLLKGLRPYGWGCLILFKNNLWKKIPEELKIWFTDDWIIKYNPCKKYILDNFSIKTDMSTTSGSDEFFVTRSGDSVYWDSLEINYQKDKYFDGYL